MVRNRKGQPVEILEKDLDVEDLGIVRARYPLDSSQGTVILPISLLIGDDGVGEIRAALERVPSKDLLGRGNPVIIQALEFLIAEMGTS